MPEHNVVKHTKAIVNTIREPHLSWKRRLADILVEIAIIVFAISLSLLLERWRENIHERTIEKKFLLGLRTNLQNDIHQLQADSLAYSTMFKGWNYLRGAGINNTPLNSDSARLYTITLISIRGFNPSNSRFEALKSSGEFNVIEDDSLQNMILDLYQSKIIVLRLTTDYLSHLESEQLLPFLAKNIRFNKDGTNNMQDVIKMPEMQNYLLVAGSAIETIQRYHLVIAESHDIINMINKQYGY